MSEATKKNYTRMELDLMKLIMSQHEVSLVGDCTESNVVVRGPPNTPYEGGLWWVRVYLPSSYPFKPPCIEFFNKIYHPNIDEVSGSVSCDVIAETWSPIYDLCFIFDTFLPQLLTSPNTVKPLNTEAHVLFVHFKEAYNSMVVQFTKVYTIVDLPSVDMKVDENDSSESSMSDYDADDYLDESEQSSACS